MRGTRLITMVAAVVAVACLGAWAIWHPSSEPESPPAAAPRAGKHVVIAVHLSAWNLHSSQPGRLDATYSKGEWHTFLRDAAAKSGRAGTLRSLRSGIEEQMGSLGRAPADVSAVLRVDAGVDDDAVDAVRNLLRDLGITDVTTQ